GCSPTSFLQQLVPSSLLGRPPPGSRKAKRRASCDALCLRTCLKISVSLAPVAILARFERKSLGSRLFRQLLKSGLPQRGDRASGDARGSQLPPRRLAGVRETPACQST